MFLNRRQFLLLTAGVGALAGCQTGGDGGVPAMLGTERVVNAGPAGNYASDGVYDSFRNDGFFVVRQGAKLFALSAICTHKFCKLRAETDHSFYCKCHGSTFDPNGKVTLGPAKRDLPIYSATIDEQGQLQVRIVPSS